MKQRIANHKVKSQHLARRAVVYLRQSSERQVRNNLESQRLQYGLEHRARFRMARSRHIR